MKTQRFATLLAGLTALFIAGTAGAHCQIPCGIYDDEARAVAMSEHITTVEKSMARIRELSTAEEPDLNQITRWVANKEHHADELIGIVTYYFMNQRLKPEHKGDETHQDAYVEQLTLLHEMMVVAMKAKQTTDAAHTARLRELLVAFEESYFGHAVGQH